MDIKELLEFYKKNYPKAYEDYLDRKTKYVKGKGGRIIEIENPDFIGPRKKAKGGMINKYAKGGSVKKKNKMLTTKGWGASRKT